MISHTHFYRILLSIKRFFTSLSSSNHILGNTNRSSLQKIVQSNYKKTLKEIERDLANRTRLPASLWTRISVIKMNVLPCINFLSMMIPLSPKVLSGYIWNNGHPKLKLSALQRPKDQGGLALPNFKVYHQSFQLHPVVAWFDGRSCISWKYLEKNLVHPRRLEDVLFSNIKDKYCMLRYGPIIVNTIRNFKIVERNLKGNSKWHSDAPLWHNINVQIGNKPLDFKPWSLKGINVIGDLYDGKGMLSYQDLKDHFDLQDSSFFYYLQIRSALKAQGVHLMHPLINWINSLPSRGFVSKVYSKLSGQQETLSMLRAWQRLQPER